VPHLCLHINSLDISMLPNSMDGQNSPVCRITIISFIARKNVKCFQHARKLEWGKPLKSDNVIVVSFRGLLLQEEHLRSLEVQRH
jgi:hypothetical protein